MTKMSQNTTDAHYQFRMRTARSLTVSRRIPCRPPHNHAHPPYGINAFTLMHFVMTVFYQLHDQDGP